VASDFGPWFERLGSVGEFAAAIGFGRVRARTPLRFLFAALWWASGDRRAAGRRMWRSRTGTSFAVTAVARHFDRAGAIGSTRPNSA
jgi:hypothetical protein